MDLQTDLQNGPRHLIVRHYRNIWGLPDDIELFKFAIGHGSSYADALALLNTNTSRGDHIEIFIISIKIKTLCF